MKKAAAGENAGKKPVSVELTDSRFDRRPPKPSLTGRCKVGPGGQAGATLIFGLLMSCYPV